MKLQIGFLTERLILGFGVDLAVHQYASYLQGQGHDVTVFCERHELIVERKYRVIDLGQRAADLVRTESMTRNIVNFARFFNDFTVDVWIVNTPPFYDLIPLLLSPCIAIEYGTPPSKFFSEVIGRDLDASVAYRFRHVFSHLRSCDRILCISRSIQEWLPKSARAFSDVLYLGCDHYGRVRQADARAFRQSVGVRESQVLTLWVGRVQIREDQQPYKGFPEFVRIAEQGGRLDRDLKFMVVGRGGEEEAKFLGSKELFPVSISRTTRWEGPMRLPISSLTHPNGKGSIYLCSRPSSKVFPYWRTITDRIPKCAVRGRPEFLLMKLIAW
jgi:glycosyltransferase involved in cell wall biosynthesis